MHFHTKELAYLQPKACRRAEKTLLVQAHQWAFPDEIELGRPNLFSAFDKLSSYIEDRGYQLHGIILKEGFDAGGLEHSVTVKEGD